MSYQKQFFAYVSIEYMEFTVIAANTEGQTHPPRISTTSEMQEAVAEAYAKIKKQIKAEEKSVGFKLHKAHPIVELVGEDESQPVPSPGAYLKMTVHVYDDADKL